MTVGGILARFQEVRLNHSIVLLVFLVFTVFVISVFSVLDFERAENFVANVDPNEPIVTGAKFVNLEEAVEAEQETSRNTQKPEKFRWDSDKIYPRSQSTFFDWYEAAIVNHEKKMLFCWIPKNSCTKFKLMLAEFYQPNVVEWLNTHRTKEGEDWEAEETVHLHMNHLFNRTIKLKREGVDRILDDPKYSKVVFIRDPIERFISGFWDKCGPNGTRKVMCKHKGLSEYINYLYEEHYLTKTLCEVRDHFRAQFCFCGLYRNKMEQWDVYAFNRQNRQIRIESFIEKYHLEDHAQFFKHGTSHAGKQKLKTPLEDLLDSNTLSRLYKVFENDILLFEYYNFP